MILVLTWDFALIGPSLVFGLGSPRYLIVLGYAWGVLDWNLANIDLSLWSSAFLDMAWLRINPFDPHLAHAKLELAPFGLDLV